MQKSIILLILFLTACSVGAQNRALGLRVAKYSGSYFFPKESEFAKATFQPTSGVEAALQYHVYLSSKLCFQTELSWYHRKYEALRIESSFLSQDTFMNLQGSTGVFSFPIMIRGYFKKNNFMGYLAGGFSFGLIQERTVKSYSYYNKYREITFEKTEAGIPLEAGIGYKLNEHIQLEASARINWGSFNTRIRSTSTNTSVNNNWYVKRLNVGLSVLYLI
jgi:Outer membrane protein beta-barrel domain